MSGWKEQYVDQLRSERKKLNDSTYNEGEALAVFSPRKSDSNQAEVIDLNSAKKGRTKNKRHKG